jgi:hypothetical protein
VTNPVLFVSVTAILWAAPKSGAAHFTVKINDHENVAQHATSLPRSRSSLSEPAKFRNVPHLGLLVRTWVNGTGPYTFAIDTGAGITLVSENVVRQARLSVRTTRRTFIGGLSGSSAASDREAVIEQIALGEPQNILPSGSVAILAPNLPSDIDGILDPTNVYSPLGYAIDLPNRQIEAFDSTNGGLDIRQPPPDGTIVRWLSDGRSRRPFVRLSDGRLALLDTGSGLGLAVAQEMTFEHGQHSIAVRDISGGTIHARRVAPTTVSIGSLVLRAVPTDIVSGAETGAPVIIGRDALYPFRLTFDPIRRLIEIAPARENRRR